MIIIIIFLVSTIIFKYDEDFDLQLKVINTKPSKIIKVLDKIRLKPDNVIKLFIYNNFLFMLDYKTYVIYNSISENTNSFEEFFNKIIYFYDEYHLLVLEE